MSTPPVPDPPSGGRPPRSEQSVGLLSGTAAYGLWGILPLYFVLVSAADPVEIVASRVLWSLLFCGLLIAVTRQGRQLMALVADPRAIGWLGLAAAFIAVNWLTYTLAVLSHDTVSAAMGYYINPLVSTALGVLLLGERLSRLQWLAVGIAVVAVVVLAVGYGSLPWTALILATSFAFYGYAKNRVGKRTTAVASLTVETALLALPAAIAIAVLSARRLATATELGSGHFWLLAASGVITAVPLLLFGTAASRLPLSTLGSLQYLAPTLQFVIALVLFHEPMPVERWIGFLLVWIAIIVFSVDLFRRRPRRTAGA
ncbi:EamA family transporter RarD [Zhihengliuella alba]|uniref:EamA family transporter RarD n=1 Tax=Zhihengliuella alba TaxID=547018 RepID=A0ABP7D4Y7_9MICC